MAIRDVLLFLSFSMGCFPTCSKSCRLCQQIRNKGTFDQKRHETEILLCIGIAFIVLFAVLYRKWLYGSAICSWPTDEQAHLLNIFFSIGIVVVIMEVVSLIQNHSKRIPLRENINALAYLFTGIGLIVIAGILLHQLLSLFI